MSLLPSVLALGLLMGGPADTAGPKTNVEPKPKPEVKGEDAQTGQLMIGLHLGRPLPRLASGGKWTRTEPYWVRVRLGEFVYAQWVFFQPPTW